MSERSSYKRSGIRAALILFMSLLLGLACSTAFGHEWTVGGKKVEAKIVNFNGSQIVLENQKGKRKAFALNELVAEDLKYIADLLAIRNIAFQQELHRQQLAVQQQHLLAQILEIWTISMIAPNGDIAWRNYFATNSLQAKQLAQAEFPHARIVGAQRLRGQNRIGILPKGLLTPPTIRF